VKLTEHFSVEEFTASDTAARLGIDNSLPATMLQAARATCEMLERVRAHLSALAGRPVPIILTSGYRCPRLNSAIGGAPTSDHMQARAADFKAPAFGSPYQVARALAPHITDLEIGQLIHEYGTWVHASTQLPAKQFNRIITVSRRGAEVGILEAS
jgi:zinc D-Ala-D-Ala carboxypeptidase